MLANLAMQNKKYLIYPQTNLKWFFIFCILYCIHFYREGGNFSHARKMCNAKKGMRNSGEMNIVKVLLP